MNGKVTVGILYMAPLVLERKRTQTQTVIQLKEFLACKEDASLYVELYETHLNSWVVYLSHSGRILSQRRAQRILLLDILPLQRTVANTSNQRT